uniref:USP domain-containing protein n=1 Tax=viral metagenome TaxID=1070528 RepID=A0A6C0C7R5_9ZZZZ
MSQGNKGFKNNGNTCYLNAILQCLSHIDILNNNDFKKNIIKYKKNNTPLLDEWLNIQNLMWSDNIINNVIDPINLIRIFNNKCINNKIFFESFNQNDASEFLPLFLDFMHNEFSRKINMTIKGNPTTNLDKLYYKNLELHKKQFNNNYSYIIDNFYTSGLSLTQCPDCNFVNDNHEIFIIITLDLNEKVESLYDCLDNYTKTEELDDDNKFKCEKCSDYVNASRKLLFWDLSPIIIILLKKYNINGVLSKSVKYPIELDMTKYCMNYKDNSTKYELSSLCIQNGGLNSGHYYSICKNTLDNKWNIYNDSHVQNILEKDIFNNHPYLLFYKRK